MSLIKGFLVFLISVSAASAVAQGTVFTYQGTLNDGDHPATGVYDLTFTLYDSTNQPGNIVGGTITNLNVRLANGSFVVPLDFGNVFDGTSRWLQIGVRTNGAAGFAALDPRQMVTPVPYAIFSGNTTNLLGPLSTANLAPVAALIASASNGLSASFSTNLVSFTNNGLESSFDATRLASAPEQQAGIQRTPIRGFLTWYAYGANATEGLVSNVMYWTKADGLYNFGYDWIFIDDGWGTTNRDANGNLQWNTNKYPSGPAFVNVAHRMGFKIALYTDGGYPNGLTASGSQSASTPAHMAQDVDQFLRWNFDGGKWDVPLLNLQLGMAVLATNTARPFYVIGGNPFPGSGAVDAQWALTMNAFRGGGGVGDLTSYGVFLAWCDQFSTNGFYRWIRPGHVYDFDGIYFANNGLPPGPPYGTQAQIIMDAISSGIMLHCNVFPNGLLIDGLLPQLTNSSVLDIQADPAVIAGQRVMQTNNIDVWLKPLGSDTGPQFAIGLISRGGSLSNYTFTIPLDSTGLNLPAASQQNIGYSIYDCVSNTWVSVAGVTSLTVTLTNYQPALFRLFPGAAVTTNYIQPFSYNATLTALVISNGTQRILNLPWDPDAAKFIARAQLASDPVQCYAIQFLFAKLKSIGLWTNRFDVLYPIIPAQPYLNAFSTNFTLVPVGPVTTNALGIAGNGSTSYFTNGYHFVNSAINFSLNSGSMGFYNGTPVPVGTSWMGAFDGASETVLADFSDSVWGALNDLSGNGVPVFGNATGLWITSRTGAGTAYTFGHSAISNRSALSLTVPNSYIVLDGEMRNGFPSQCNAQLRGAWVGGGFTPSEMWALKDIWDQYETILGRAAQ
jgi:Alpha galactosidase A